MGKYRIHQSVIDKIERHVTRNMDAAAIFLVGEVRRSFGSPPPEIGKSGKQKRNSSKKWKRAHPSKPWTPPNVQTGALRRSITWAYSLYSRGKGRLGRRVGTSLPYGFFLELGTSRILPRPFLRPALWHNRDRIRDIITRPMR